MAVSNVSSGNSTASPATLGAPAPTGATSLSVAGSVPSVTAQRYMGVGVGGATCEIATVTPGSSGSTINTSSLLNTHAAGEQVVMLDSADVPYWWFGIVGDGIADDSLALIRASIAGLQSRNLTLNGQGHACLLNAPVVYASEMRRRNFKYFTGPNFTPADCDNALICEQGGGYTTPNTFTAASGIITTALAAGMVTGTAFMLRGTSGLAGALEGRIYYAIKTDNTHYTVASTLANALALIADTTPTAGSGLIFCGLQDIGRSYLDEEFTNTSSSVGGAIGVPGVNGYRRNGQQPGYSRKQRIDNAAQCLPPGAFALLNASLTTGAPITSFTVKGISPYQPGIPSTIPAGTIVTMIYGNQSQAWTLSAQANPGDVTLAVNSQTPNFAYQKSGSGQGVVWLALPPTVTPGAGGTMAAGTYLVQTTYVNFLGETLPGPQASAVVAANGTLAIASPPTMTNAGDQNIKSSNAQSWYAYVSQGDGATLTRQQAAGSPTPIGTPLALTAPPTSTGATPPAISTAGAWGAWWSGQQYKFDNYESIGCDNAILAEAATMFDIFGRLDIEAQTSYGVRTLPAQTFANSGRGLRNWTIAGLHTELNANLQTNVFDLTNVDVGPPRISLCLITPWISKGAGVGAFINNPLGAGLVIVNAAGGFPSAPGFLFIADPINGNRDAWTDYHQYPPPLIVIPTQGNSGGYPTRAIDTLGQGATQLNGLVLRRIAITDANYTQKVGDSYIGWTAITAARTLTLLSAGLYAGSGLLIVADESGAVTATNQITVNAAAGETINGAASAAITTARGVLRLISNGSNAWTII